MGKPFFGQALSTILTAILLGQFTLGTSIAEAQSSGGDPFWSSSNVNPKDTNFWFNQSPNPMDPTQPNTNDPWGSWSDPGGNGWNNLGPNQGWDLNSNPYGGLGDMWGNNNMMTNVRPTDPFYVQLMRWSGVITKNYAARVKEKRIQYGAYSSEDNDYLANQIIREESWRAAEIGAGATLIPSLLAALQANTPGLNGASMMYGYGTGMALGVLGDFFGVIVAQANMMYTLKELYGELSTDDDERVADSTLPFVVGSTAATISNYFAKQLMVSPSYPQPGPGPGPDPGPAPVPPQPLVTAADKAAAEKLATENAADHAVMDATVKRAATQSEKGFMEKTLFKWSQSLAAKREAGALAQTAMDKQAEQLIARNGVVEKLEGMVPKANPLAKKHWALKWLQGLPSPIRLLIAAGAAFGTNLAMCYTFGILAKKHFRARHRHNLLNVIQTLRTYPAARATTWLILIRDIFPHMGDEAKAEGKKAADRDARMYAAILMNEMPLVINKETDELQSILKDYHDDNKIIDKYLAALRHPLPIESKLEMIKVLYAAALMKGYPTFHEMQTIDTVAVGLGLKPPNNVNTQQLEQHPEDLRVKNWWRYEDLLFRMNKAIHEQYFNDGKVNPVKPKGYKQANKWRSGQIILQDFNSTGMKDYKTLMEDIQNAGGLISPKTSKQANCIAEKVTNQPDPWEALNPPTPEKPCVPQSPTNPGNAPTPGIPQIPQNNPNDKPADSSKPVQKPEQKPDQKPNDKPKDPLKPGSNPQLRHN